MCINFKKIETIGEIMQNQEKWAIFSVLNSKIPKSYVYLDFSLCKSKLHYLKNGASTNKTGKQKERRIQPKGRRSPSCCHVRDFC